jgi:two-component system cell cycle response regulator
VDAFQAQRNGRSAQESGDSGTDAVLIAEDDPVFRHLLQNWLLRWNYRVIALDNGLDAWAELTREHSPKMAILDWMMPGMDGLELCRMIRTQEPSPYRYVLLLTAKSDKQDVVTGLDAGADDYLTKPFNVEELRARVRAGKRILELQDALLRAQTALQFEAAHDPLTGLWNRGAMLDLLRGETHRYRRTGCPLGVMMGDLDNFKRINDSYGHLVGDTVLREVGSRLSASLRDYDLVGRYGGEEFLAVVPGCNLSDLTVRAENMREAISAAPINTAAGPVRCSISIGVVATPLEDTGLEYETLLRAADQALYAAKANGRNRVEVAPLALPASQGA